MRNASRSRYAVAALVDLALQPGPGPVALAEIARRQSVSISYLEQVFSVLRQNDFVKSVRGPGGGYLLTRPADKIRVSDIFTAFTSAKNLGGETGGGDENRAGASLAGLWAALDREILRLLGNVTVGDLLAGGGSGIDLAQAAE